MDQTKFSIAPAGGWAPIEHRRQLQVTGSDLIAAGIGPGPEIGFVFHHLIADLQAGTTVNERETLLQRARHHLRSWKPLPPPRFRITGHAIERFIERVAPDRSASRARQEMIALAHAAPFSRRAPEWATNLQDREKIRGGYLKVADDVAFAVSDGWIRTVLTRELVERYPTIHDPFPECGEEREDPQWPERRYIADSEGRIQCRTILDGRIVTGTGRSTYLAWQQLRRAFGRLGELARFEQGQADYRRRWQRPSREPLNQAA